MFCDQLTDLLSALWHKEVTKSILKEENMQLSEFVVTLFTGKANQNNITVAAVMGLNALKQGLSATILLMVEAVEFSVPDATKGIDIGAPFKEVGGIWEQFMELGGQVCICDACLTHNGFTKDQIDKRYEIIGGGEVIALLSEAKGTLQIT